MHDDLAKALGNPVPDDADQDGDDDAVVGTENFSPWTDHPYRLDEVITVTITTGALLDPNPRVEARMVIIDHGDADTGTFDAAITDEQDTKLVADGIQIIEYDKAAYANPWFLVYLVLLAAFNIQEEQAG